MLMWPGNYFTQLDNAVDQCHTAITHWHFGARDAEAVLSGDRVRHALHPRRTRVRGTQPLHHAEYARVGRAPPALVDRTCELRAGLAGADR